MKTLKNPLALLAIGVSVLLVVLITHFISRYRRPHTITCKLVVAQTIAISVDKAFDLSNLSLKHSATEDGQRRAGILVPLDTADLKDVLGVSLEANAKQKVLWSYGFRADSLSRINDIFGEDTLKLSGSATQKKKFFLYLVDEAVVDSITNLDLY